MENKTPPAFWEEIEKQCPAIMQHFKNWIDAYKEEVNWDILFAPK
jgi:hypothetical protein